MYGGLATQSMGVFFPEFSFDDFRTILNKYGNGEELQLENFDWNSLPPRDKNILLTDLHEFDHYDHLIASPFGILLFRIYNVLTRDVIWLGKEFEKLGLALNNGGKPLMEWLINEGVGIYEAKKRLAATGAKDIEYLTFEVIPGLFAVTSLLELITSKNLPPKYKNLTVGEFCAILNWAYRYLRKRCDVDIIFKNGQRSDWEDVGFVWDTKLPKSTRIFQEGVPFFSYFNILECLAYFRELKYLDKQNANNGVFGEWFKERFPADYYWHYQLFNLLFKDPTKTRGYLNTFLDSRVDLTSGSKNIHKTKHFVEEEWPFFIINDIQSSFDIHTGKLSNRVQGLQAVVDRGRLFGEDSNWRKLAGDQFAAMDFNSYALGLEKKFLEGIRRLLIIREAELRKEFLSIDVHDLIGFIEYADIIRFSKKDFRYDFTVEELQEYVLKHLFSCLFPWILTIGINVVNGNFTPIPEDFAQKVRKSIETHFHEIFSDQTLLDNQFNEISNNLFAIENLEKIFLGVEINWFVPVKRS